MIYLKELKNMSLPNFDTSSLNMVDFIALGIVILSVLIGLIRGFTREILGALGWSGAVFITFWARVALQAPVRHWVGNPLIADLMTIVFVFIITLFILLSITRAVSLRVKASVLGGLDRSLGVVFGIVRGGVICIIIFLMVNLYYKPYRRPPEVIESRAFPYLLKGTELVASFFPQGEQTYWLNLARSVRITWSQSPCAVRLRRGAQLMQCLLSS